jgi:hypothetical protein
MEDHMYSKDELLKGIRNPSLVVKEAHLIIERLHQMYWRHRNHIGINVVDQTWDNLIVLDACRFDYFKKISTLAGELRAVTSQGSSTIDWLESNFDGYTFDDIVYISGNPNLTRINADFADIVRLWEDDWDEKLSTARPEAMVEKTLEAHAEYPHKTSHCASRTASPSIPRRNRKEI